MMMVVQRLLVFDVLSRTSNKNMSTWQSFQFVRRICNCNSEYDTLMNLALSSVGSRLLQEVMADVSVMQLLQWQRICLQYALRLTEHRHGNFVVTKLIQVSPSWFCSRLCVALSGHVCRLARHQCGSRVLERIMERCCSRHINALFDERPKS